MIFTDVVTVTTIADGTATAYSNHITGRLLEIRYVKTDYAAGVDFTITTETTGQGLWTESDVNASTVRRPLAASHGAAGTALNYNDESDEPVCVPIYIAGERVKFVLAQGGDTKTGTFTIVYEA